jgi:DedD protein
MRQVFEEREIDEVERGRETELTLSSAGVLMILGGLVLVCGLCFFLGYSAGRHGSEESATASLQPAAGADTPLVASANKQKPSAAPQPIAAPPAEAAVADTGSPNDPDADIVTGPGTTQALAASQPASGAAPASGQWTVKPAIPPQQIQPSAQPAGLATAPGILVQIAAVSHLEDAEVLVNALRRRGYAVTTRRDLVDNLIHVQVGPFNNRNDANAMRLKLLNDGYNAIVEP